MAMEIPSHMQISAVIRPNKLYIWNEESAFPEHRTGPSQIGRDFVEHQFDLVRIRIEGTLITLGDVLLDPNLVA